MFALLPACASRSALHAVGDDASVIVDAAPETYDREASGAACMSRPTSCPRDDFGPLKGVTAVYDACVMKVGAACGDMTMVFDDDGCLVALLGIQGYSPAFVDCVEKTASATRWICAPGKRLNMFQGCAP